MLPVLHAQCPGHPALDKLNCPYEISFAMFTRPAVAGFSLTALFSALIYPLILSLIASEFSLLVCVPNAEPELTSDESSQPG